MELLLLRLSFVLTCGAVSVSANCRIGEVKTEKAEATSVVVSWSATGCSIREYEVTVKHKRFLACLGDEGSGTRRPPNLDTSMVTNGTKVTVSNLRPFSSYKVSVAEVDEEEEETARTFTVVDTKPGSPETSAREDEDGRHFPMLTQAINFHWLPPDPSDPLTCRLQNGIADGFRAELWGVDRWVRSNQPVQTANVPDKVFQHYAQGLLPGTRYMLKVYVRNQGGLFNHTTSLDLVKRTLPTVPLPPTEFKATPMSSLEVNLRWVPSYPPKGQVEKYVVRRGTGKTWNEEIEIRPEENACSYSTSTIPFKDPFCYVIAGLEANTSYTFQVKTFNVNISQPSDYSRSVTVATDPDPLRPQKPTAAPPPTEKISTEAAVRDDEVAVQTRGGRVSIVTVVALSVAILVVAVCCFILRQKIRSGMEELVKMKRGGGNVHRQFQNEPMTPPTQPSVVFWNGRHPSEVSYVERSVVDQISDIQRRRLPEPPPTGQEANEEPPRRQENAVDGDNPYSIPSDQTAATESSSSRVLRRQASSKECTDTYGYLRPTFDREPSRGSLPLSVHGDILAESYDALPPNGDSIPLETFEPPTNSKSQNETHPLMPPNSGGSVLV